MSMPKASMDENYCSMLSQDDVGASRQGSLVNAKSQPHPVKQSPHHQFRRRILSLHRLHPTAGNGHFIHDGTSMLHPKKIHATISALIWQLIGQWSNGSDSQRYREKQIQN